MGNRPLPDRIHIVGASGSGTTTLAAAVAAKHGHRHLDTRRLLLASHGSIVFLAVPTDVRMQRLRTRELARYGHDAIAPGGRLHQAHVAFLEWAARYDHADATERSRTLHDGWLAAVAVPVVRIEGDRPVAAQLASIEAAAAGERFAE